MNSSLDFASLLLAARSGDTEMLGRLLDRYREYLRLLCRLHVDERIVGKFDDSDVLQETFLEASRDFGSFAGAEERELTAWLRRILANNLANFRRQYLDVRARDVDLERAVGHDLDRSSKALAEALADSDTSPSGTAMKRENAVLLADALIRLPEDYREVIVLRNLQELPFVEVARRMGRTLDSVEKLWTRALIRLRRELPTPPGS